MEKINNVSLISPKSLNELIVSISKYPKSTLFAGGTYIMRQPNYYPQKEPCYYISLAGVSELHRVLHADRFVELGSMITIGQLLNMVSNTFSREMFNALSSIGTSVLKNQITIGGALCTEHSRYSLCCILSAVKAQAELKFFIKNGLFHRIKVKSRWIPVEKLYDSNGEYLYPENTVLTRVRIPSDKDSILAFKTAGSFINSPCSAVIMTLQYSIIQDNMVSPSLCLSFVENGLFNSSEFDSVLRSLRFPLSNYAIQKTSSELERLIKAECPKVSEIQAERARRLTLQTLFEANNNYLRS